MREKRSPCPIPNTHRRLQDLHRLWHQTLESYSDPDGFRVNLNAAIEAARNVTFMLQSEKAAIPEFDRWYASEQEALRSDELMTWLRDARNTVVKQADLETTSTAVALVHDNLDFARWKMTVPPVVPTEAIAMALVKSAPPEVRQMLPYFIVSVERTWMATSLPDRELLDALAHAYSKLLGIVIAAHDRTATDIGSCSLASPVHAAESTAEVPACMRVTRESRTVRVTLQDQRPLTTGVQAVPYDEKLGEEQTKRYKTKKLHFNIDEEPDAEIIGERMVEFANRVLVRDRYHERITFVRVEGKYWKPITILAGDRQEKYALMRMLASEVERLRADAVIEIGEVWISKGSTFRETGLLPADAPDREEALVVSVAQPGRRVKRWSTPFTRGKRGRIILGQTELEELRTFYLEPIFQVWEQQNEERSAAGQS